MKPIFAAIVMLLLFLLLLVPRPASASASCGNLVCETGEDRNNCPQDCCMRVKNGVCSFYPQCLQYDPDCCAPGVCASSEYTCLAGNNTKQVCPTGYCSGGGCASSCTSYLQCASGYCSGGGCAQNAAQNGVPADGAQSCRECYSVGGLCAPCSSCLSINSQGYGVYKGDAVTISYEISNNCGFAVSPVDMSVSGPLRKYAALSQDSFSSIASFETKRFSITVSGIPSASYSYGAAPPGEYELKLSATAPGGVQSSYVSYVFVLPSAVFSSGTDIPANKVVGHSVRETLMRQGTAILPVEVEVWAW